MEHIEVYTDGGCSGNPGPGGWAFIVCMGNEIIRCSGGEKNTTNNRMELQAVIEALKFLKGHHREKKIPIVLHTDSQYVRQGITSWIHTWLKNNWRTAARKPVKNKEYWITLKELDDALRPQWKWVPGHAGIELNEQCDAMVQDEVSKFQQPEGQGGK